MSGTVGKDCYRKEIVMNHQDIEERKRYIEEIMLDHVGESNAIFAEDIACLVLGGDAVTSPTMRRIIKQCIEDLGLPIASSQRGYFLIETVDEFEEYMDNLELRKEGITKRMEVVQDAFLFHQHRRLRERDLAIRDGNVVGCMPSASKARDESPASAQGGGTHV